MLRVVISGITGRMGKALLSRIYAKEDFCLVSGITTKNNKSLGQDLGEIVKVGNKGVPIVASFKDIPETDVVIDFSEPNFSLKAIDYSLENHLPIVIGTTGFEKKQLNFINKASETIPILLAPNTSIGIALIKKLFNFPPKALLYFDEIKIREKHHKDKLDSPSGTALDLSDYLSKKTKRKKIAIESEREGVNAGEHKIILAKGKELVEVSHKVLDRSVFVEGALLGANWIFSQPKGLYNMSDIYS